MANNPIFLGTMKNFVARIQNADGSTKITIVTAANPATKVTTLAVSSTDTADRDIALYITVSAVDYLIGTVKIPLNSGNTNAIGAIDLLSQAALLPWVRVDENGSKYLILENGSVLKASATTTVTAGKEIDFFGHGGNF